MGIEDNMSDVAKSTLEAYKVAPYLTALLIVNLVFLVGFGYLLMKKNEAHEALVVRILDEEKLFRTELVQAATSCTPLPSGKPGYYRLQGPE